MDVPMEGAQPRLRPLTLSDILDGVFKLYRSNFLTLLGIAAVLQIPLILLQLLLTTALGQRFTTNLIQLMQELPTFNPTQDSFTDLHLGGIALFITISLVLALVQGLVVQQLIQGALTSAVAGRYLGRPVSIGEAYRSVFRHLGALLGAACLLSLVGLVAVSVAVGVMVGVIFLVASTFSGASSSSSLVAAITAFFVIVGAFIMLMLGLAAVLVRFVFFTQAAVVENHGPVSALRRSWDLVRGSYWRVLGIVVLIWILCYILAGLPATFASVFIQLIFSDPLKDFAVRQGLTSVVTYGAQILVLPIQLIAYTLLYYDLRVRKEGYDLQLMAEQAAWQ